MGTRGLEIFLQIYLLEPPGKYQVHLESDGTTYPKELIAVKDPHSEGTIEDIKLQNDSNKIYNDLNTTAMYVNSIESIRRQLIDLKSALSGNGKDDNLISEVDNLERKFLHIEKKLLQLKTTGKGRCSKISK